MQIWLKAGTGHTQSGAEREGFPGTAGYKQDLEGKVEQDWQKEGFSYILHPTYFETAKLKKYLCFEPQIVPTLSSPSYPSQQTDSKTNA